MLRGVAWLVVGLCGCDGIFKLERPPVEAPSDAGDAVDAVDAAIAQARTIHAGDAHTCAVRELGAAIRCWGDGADGRLGYGNTTIIGDTETAGAGGDLDLAAGSLITLGAAHTCAWAGGAMKCWGSNVEGRLGYGDTVTRGDNEPLSLVGAVSAGANVTQVAAGAAHTCALFTDGRVACWGEGDNGRLGYGNTNDRGASEVPSQIGRVQLGGLATAIAAGGAHTCALLAAGGVQCWGRGTRGQLGYGSTNDVGALDLPMSQPVLNLGMGISQLAAGGDHTCVLLGAGDVMCWGEASEGQLGLGNNDPDPVGDNELPTIRVQLGARATAIALGRAHTCALLETGAVHCWGRGGDGQLGYGNGDNIGDDETPRSAGAVPLAAPAIAIAAGGAHSCAVLVSGNVTCWGRGAQGQLGYGNTDTIGDGEAPSSVPAFSVF